MQSSGEHCYVPALVVLLLSRGRIDLQCVVVLSLYACSVILVAARQDEPCIAAAGGGARSNGAASDEAGGMREVRRAYFGAGGALEPCIMFGRSCSHCSSSLQ